jgi:Zn-finger protein
MIPESPLKLADWASQSVEARLRSSNYQTGSRYELDPRISQERRLQLIQAFNDIDKDKSGKLSYEEIFNYLKDINEKVDDNYVRKIFESMDVNRDGVVSSDEFIQAYLGQIDGLSAAVAQLRQRISEKNRDLTIQEEQLAEAIASERLNSYGIMVGSLITVRVVEAQNLTGLTGRPSAFATILCEKQTISTKIIKNERNPGWDETFSFRITNGTGELVVQVMNEGRISKDDLLGSCSIPLTEFADQQKHEKWFHLKGSSSSARVLLSVQWIHQKTRYIQQIIDNLKREIESDNREMEKIEEQMMKMGTNPLGMFKKDSWLDKIEAKIVGEVDEIADKHFQVFFI